MVGREVGSSSGSGPGFPNEPTDDDDHLGEGDPEIYDLLGGARLGSVAPCSEPGEGAHRWHCGEHGHGGHTRKMRSRVRGLQGVRASG